MPSVSQSSVSELRKRRKAILAELSDLRPALMMELASIELALKDKAPSDGPYANIRAVIDATILHLNTIGKPLTKREISEGLLEGGYYRGDDMGPYMIRDAVNYHVKKGRLIEHPDGTIGLPDWKLKK